VSEILFDAVAKISTPVECDVYSTDHPTERALQRSAMSSMVGEIYLDKENPDTKLHGTPTECEIPQVLRAINISPPPE